MKDLGKIFYGNIVAYDAAIIPAVKQEELQNVIWRSIRKLQNLWLVQKSILICLRTGKSHLQLNQKLQRQGIAIQGCRDKIDEAIAIQANNDIEPSAVEDHQAKPMCSMSFDAIVFGLHLIRVQLLKVLETRKTVLQKEQGIAFACVVAARGKVPRSSCRTSCLRHDP
ncbi:unnamed protein product [Ilex paraguariensis]|uniref:Ubiquinol-cytochrome c chaperone domain-containing protein n=1 Tax=Ilex paraguariensis TaxID=185542 RepID=A0ABC8QXL3_9AQUA